MVFTALVSPVAMPMRGTEPLPQEQQVPDARQEAGPNQGSLGSCPTVASGKSNAPTNSAST